MRQPKPLRWNLPCRLANSSHARTSLRFFFVILWPAILSWLLPAPSHAQTPEDVIVCLGDSITAGLGVESREAYPQLLASDLGVQVVVEGIPGATAEDGLVHVDRVLAHDPWLVIVELGGNDVLRQIEPERTEQALRGILKRVLHAGASALLVEVPGLPETGHQGLHRRLAEDLEVPLVGDVLPQILDDPQFKLDSVHPNAAGHRRLAAALADRIRPWIEAQARSTP